MDKFGFFLVMTLMVIVGIIAGQAISSIGNRTDTTFQDVASRLGSSTPEAPEASESKRQTEDPIDADAGLLKGLETTQRGIQKIREEYKDRVVKIIAPLDACLKFGFLTEAQSDVLQQYKGEFERLYIEGMTQTNEIERDLRRLRGAARRLRGAGASTEDITSAAQDGKLILKSIMTRLKILDQLDDEWIGTSQEYNRRVREVEL